MKKILPICLSLLTGACAIPPQKTESVEPVKEIIVDKTDKETNLVEKISNTLLWDSFSGMLILLDKNKKPLKSQEFYFDNPKETTLGKTSPKITVTSFPNGQQFGRVLQISCTPIDIKQKFDNPALLKGWAVDFICNKQNYFVIINNK